MMLPFPPSGAFDDEFEDELDEDLDDHHDKAGKPPAGSDVSPNTVSVTDAQPSRGSGWDNISDEGEDSDEDDEEAVDEHASLKLASYERSPVAEETLSLLESKWLFVGLDLAPNEMLETGITVIDRQRQLTRMDKLSTDEQILLFLKGLGPQQNIMVTLDVPKSLAIRGRWRQEEIKMHPLRLNNHDGSFTDRCASRAWALYDAMTRQGVTVVLCFMHQLKMRYDMFIPFRTRTPLGCRALQAAIKTHLGLDEMPTNLAPSSVLDAMIAAYAGWSLYEGQEHTHYRLFADEAGRVHLEAIKRVNREGKRNKGRRRGKYYRFASRPRS